jgi:GNAT superfamily N-acetyltransferase
MSNNAPLPLGCSPVPRGKIANVVTCLEMTAPPRPMPARPVERLLLVEAWPKPNLADYRALFRAVGERWMWFSRLVMPDEALRTILAHPAVETFRLRDGHKPIGLLELDFREPRQCELAFFGVVESAIGQGAGRFLIDFALHKAWSHPIDRMWVHTCTFDHPAAIAFYMRSGFKPYEVLVEVADDPRLTGHLPPTAAPHVPLIGAAP